VVAGAQAAGSEQELDFGVERSTVEAYLIPTGEPELEPRREAEQTARERGLDALREGRGSHVRLSLP
jgi:hypothetical protein